VSSGVVEAEEFIMENVSGYSVPVETLTNIPGFIYRVNILMEMQFNSTKFGGKPFFTAASAMYKCYNESDSTKCEVNSFLQNARRKHAISDVASYVRESINKV